MKNRFKLRNLLLLIALLVLLSACSSSNTASNTEKQETSPGLDITQTTETSPPKETSSSKNPEEAGAETNNTFTLKQAESKFSETHPDATITVSKQQGNAYYVEGWAGNMLYRMKFSTLTGEVILDETIRTGKQG